MAGFAAKAAWRVEFCALLRQSMSQEKLLMNSYWPRLRHLLLRKLNKLDRTYKAYSTVVKIGGKRLAVFLFFCIMDS